MYVKDALEMKKRKDGREIKFPISIDFIIYYYPIWSPKTVMTLINHIHLNNMDLYKTQLFLLHFAGGSSYSYDFLSEYLKDHFDFHALELPGRGKRHREKLLKNKEECIQDYLSQIRKLRNGAPFILYGHSMGATLGLSVAKKLEVEGDFPDYLVVSGNSGPDKIEPDERYSTAPKRYLMSDKDFKQELIELGGVTMEVLGNEELYNFFSPIMRADFEVLEKDCATTKNLKINAPIYALMGSMEKTSREIENWKNFTCSDFQNEILKGNHFFIQQHAETLADIMVECSRKKSFIKI